MKAANSFASDVSRKISKLLYDQGAIDPRSGLEIREFKIKSARRHKELTKWFRDQGRNVSFDQCKSNTDKLNFSSFRKDMANRDFLLLNRRKRLKFILDVTDYLEKFENGFPESFIKVITTGKMDKEQEQFSKLLSFFLQRLKEP